MADSGSGGSDITKELQAAIEARQAVANAIFKGLQSFVSTAEGEITKLVQANTLGPDVSADMLKLQQTAIDMTIKAIEGGPLGYLNKDSGSN